MTKNRSLQKKIGFLYLDAHWHDDLPLAEELQIIASHWSDSITMIDDFQVPDDSAYSFDDYGPGKALTIDYLRRALGDSKYWVFWPRLSGSKETGARRGCAVIAIGRSAREACLANEALRQDQDIGLTYGSPERWLIRASNPMRSRVDPA